MAADRGNGAFGTLDRISARAAADSGPSSTSATIGSLSSSAITPRSGWRRSRSSVRYVPMIATRSRCSMRARNVTRWRVVASAQCRSSMTSRTGLSAASSDSRLSTAPNICWRARPAQSASWACPSPSGSRRDSTGRALMAFSMRGGAVRNASANGRYGTLSPISAHWPHSTVKPSRSAICIASATRRDLPMPASPLTSPVTARPAAASCRRPRSRPSSASRPTSVPMSLLSAWA